MKFTWAAIIGVILVGCGSEHKHGNTEEDYHEKCRKLVLSEHEVGREFKFEAVRDEIDELSITYLGDVRTRNGDTLSFVNSMLFTGLYRDSRRASAYVFIYQGGVRLGAYYVGGVGDLPVGIENGCLIFAPSRRLDDTQQCDQRTAVSFVDSIPSQIFVGCTKTSRTTYRGDLWTFVKEEG